MSTIVKFPTKLERAIAAGTWLDKNMTNPPIGEPQRYDVYTDADGDHVVEFVDEQDAIMFSLNCSQ
jgi:hypothetical protein